jgi:FKBP-type peptidyl-prolyl cis-trans isomerase (trigger factor)
MKTKVENISACTKLINIEVSPDELAEKLEQAYADIGRVARVPGFRAGKVPRDLLKTYYGDKAEEELVRRAIPEYYLKAVQEEKLVPVAPCAIENVQLKKHTLSFSARVDVKPQVKLKDYKNIKIIKKKIEVGKSQVEQTLENLRQARAKYAKENAKADEKKQEPAALPELNDAFAKNLGFATLEDLRKSIYENLQESAKIDLKANMEQQMLDELLKRASLEVPQSLVESQKEELLRQLKLNHILHGGKKEELEGKEKELEKQAREQAVSRVKLSFILDEIAQKENVQVSEEEVEKRIEAIARKSAKHKDEVKKYLEKENLVSGLEQELRSIKTVEFLLNEAQICETK